MKRVATIYDYNRICEEHPTSCEKCPLKNVNCKLGDLSKEELDDLNDAILSALPPTNRQKFLKMFPNTTKAFFNDTCVAELGAQVNSEDCANDNCEECANNFWDAFWEGADAERD